MENKKYIIKAIGKTAKYYAKDGFKAYWSNDDGWVDIQSATVFSKKETEILNLPIDGQFVEKKD